MSTMSASDADDVVLRPLVLLLASSKLDASSPTSRNDTIKLASKVVREDVEARVELGSGLGLEAAKACTSAHSHRRIATLLTTALAVHSQTAQGGGKDDDASRECLASLCQSLCTVLANSTSPTLLDECASNLIDELTSSERDESNSIRALIGPLLNVAKDETTTVGPALSIVDGLITTLLYGASLKPNEIEAWRSDMVTLFVKSTLTGSKFAPPREVQMFASYLSTLTQSEFDDHVGPAMGLKLRAQPDAAFDTVEAIMGALVRCGSDIDVTGHLAVEGDGGAKLLSAGIRQLQKTSGKAGGTRDGGASAAASFLVSLALLSGGGGGGRGDADDGGQRAKEIKAGGPVDVVVSSLCEALSASSGGGGTKKNKKPAAASSSVALSQPDQRCGAYGALDRIGTFLSDDAATIGDDGRAVLEGVANAVLEALSRALPKETDGGSGDGQSTNATVAGTGFGALLTWMALSKRLLGGAAQETDGYKSAIGYIAKPALGSAPSSKAGSASLTSTEFRFRLGSLLTDTSHSDAFVESVILDLFRVSKDLESSLGSLVEASAKKHVAAETVPQVDGIIALSLLLTNASESKSSSLLPPSAVKALAAGSTAFKRKGKTSSFVYCPAMTDASATNAVVGRVLHRTIALYCKVLSKEMDDDGGGGGGGGGDKSAATTTAQRDGLVRLTEDGKAYSAAAHALACCVANPYSPPSSSRGGRGVGGATSPSGMICSSLSTVTTYSPPRSRSADAVLVALFSRVNSLSLREERAGVALNQTRTDREVYEPINDTYAKLPVVAAQKGKFSPTSSHRGYDPNSVRRVSHLLARSVMSVESIGRVAVLSHAGSTMKLTGKSRRQREALIANTVRLLREVIIPLAKKTDEGEGKGGDDSSSSSSSSVIRSLSDFTVSCAAASSQEIRKDREKGKEGDEESKGGGAAAAPPSKGKTGGTEKKAGDSNKGQGCKEGGDSDVDDDAVISTVVHESALSLITTLGGIAGNFDPEFDDPEDIETEPYAFARRVCVEEMPSRLAANLTSTLQSVTSLETKDIDLFKSPSGVLYREDSGSSPSSAGAGGGTEKSKNAEKRRPVKSRKAKGDFGAGFEEEEWERQMKKELEAKKKKEAASSGASAQTAAVSMTPEEKKLLAVQTAERTRLSYVLEGDFPRTLAAIRCLCLSEIEVGNACLPSLANSVISAVVSSCEAFKSITGLSKDSCETLSTLAGCVFEIDEIHASTLARALAISYRQTGDTSEQTDVKGKPILTVSALPSPCAPAACAVFEMDDLGECLSGTSFAFLLPILRAALTGPRTPPGCEGALKILGRHASMLAGDEADEFVRPLRKDMANAVLELLSHDRSQTFSNPSPFDAIVSCYVTDDVAESSGPMLSTAELAPLLGESGALGGKNCRIGSMLALGSIASKHPRIVKNNPLIENRIWVNCFDKNETIRAEARKSWRIANGAAGDEDSPLPPPSKLYAVPLMPLLNHRDESIANAAANAFAHAMGMHPDTVEKSIARICASYIDAYSSSFDDGAKAVAPKPLAAPLKAPVAAPKKKKPVIDTGLPKKKVKKKVIGGTSLGKLTATTKPKKRIAGKSLVAKPKPPPVKERTFDRELLESQFQMGSAAKKDDAEKDTESKVNTRLGVLRAIASLTDSSAGVELELSVLKLLVGFLMAYGLADGNDSVRGSARNASRDVVATNGASDDAIAFLLPLFEAVLSTGKADPSCLGVLSTEKVMQDVTASDRRKEGVVVALGSVALHLKGEENADKIDGTIDMLLGALKTPNEDVQSSVALCLSKLMKKGRTQDRVATILSDLMKECLHGDNLASRRGAAYGISAVVKGSGIASLKKYEVVKQLEDACTNGPSSAKEGALYAVELLSARLGLLFEPYVIVLLPSLLKAFSDNSDHVREAASHTAGLIMSKLSAHGVKLVMPAVLTAFDDPNWRTKQASIHMLGAMSHCAPKQLASCLPKVVPKLTEAFSDTHPKVKSSAEEALDEISKVIRNPEIASISPVLLKALIDPATGTLKALEGLIETEFLHAIDAPSLALIVPVLHRGLRDRAATTKRYGALIAGNICTMINDPKDFVPYLPTLLPDLKVVLLDPIPDVRSTAAKALGSLTRGLGEATFPELRPWLIETLQAEEGSSVERSGAAQGLTEVLIAGGTSLVDSVMREEILPLKSHPKASTREGVLWVLTFLPSSLGQGYAPLIDASLPALLSGLADDSEPVRDVALRAGRVLVRSQGKAHIDKILPSLEDGLSDDDYRIRVASLTLLGDLLSMLGGTRVAKGDADTQDDIRAAERAQAQIALVLGSETRKRLLSRLYLSRSDTTAVVRQIALQVWKTVVSVTPRTLREILHVLVEQIVDALASGHPEQTEVAGRCLGDIVAKLGDAVLPEIIPVLEDALERGDVHTRRGACVGLTEVISCSSKDHINKYLDILVKAVQDALCDEDEGVRDMAASCFQSLYTVVGSRALDEVVPVLLTAMESDDEVAKVRAVNGLTGILSIRSRELLPYLVPRLLQKPITNSHADALGSIAAVTGGTLHTHFSSIIPSLLNELASFYGEDLDEEEKEREETIRECSRAVCGCVEEIGVNWLIGEIASKCGSDKEGLRKESCSMFQVLVEERKDEADFYEQLPIILRELIYRLNDESVQVLTATNLAIGALSKNVPAEELVKHVEFIRNLIASMVSDARRRKGGVGDGEFLMPGFNMKKGLEPLLPIYQRGILYGNANIREVSAAGLGELIALTDSKYLAGPFIIKMTGPLLRIVGDRNPSEVKIAIIQTLGLILTKGGPSLRAFVPQFQTTFVKALSDPSRRVRLEAIKALALLMPLSTRLDPLIKELVSGSLGKGPASAAETAGAVAVQTATLEALAVVLKHGGKKAKLPESIPSALDAGKEMLMHEDESVRDGAAKVIGAACGLLGVDVASEVVTDVILGGSAKDSSENKHGRACCMHRVLASPVGSELDQGLHDKMTTLVKSLIMDEKGTVREAACVAIGAVLGSAADTSASLSSVESSILKCMDSKETIEVARAMARGLCVAVRMKPDVFGGKKGLPILNGALKLAMSGTQRVQLAFNDFLWLALDVEHGDAGLEAYMGEANFEESRTMKTIYTKILVRTKSVKEED